MKTLSGCLLLAAVTTASAQWLQIGSYKQVATFAFSGTNLFAGGLGGGVFLSTNNGESWTAASTGLPPNTDVYALALSGTNLFAGTSGGVFLSTNNGESWTAASTGLPANATVGALAVSGTNLFAGTSGGVFLSTNNGTSWTKVLTTSPLGSVLAVCDTGLFCGTVSDVFLSTDNGTSWTSASLGVTDAGVIYALTASGTNLFAGTFYRGVFRSTDNGTNWTEVNTGLNNTHVTAFFVSGTNLLAGTMGGGVFLSTNGGTSWTEVNSGLTELYVSALAGSVNYLFMGTAGGCVWRRPLSEMVTSVNVRSTNIPTHFTLSQNYPNPFNPSTAIEFALPHSQIVSFKVYNVLGEEAATLLNEQHAAGTFKATWDASGMPSGVYFYRMAAGECVQTRKMVLMK